jgi:thiol-disulfide isomerase/thioredoxin
MSGFVIVVTYILLGVLASSSAMPQSSAPAVEGQADRLERQDLDTYRAKWQAMMNRPDFEDQQQAIRADIAALLKLKPASLKPLEVIAYGYDLLADEAALKALEGRILAEFPDSTWAQNIHAARALNEPDKLKQAGMLEAFIARYPNDARLQLMRALLFRIRANQPDTAGDALENIGDAWIRHALGAYDEIKTRLTVALVLAEKRHHLDHAAALAQTAVKLVGELADQPERLTRTRREDRPRIISDLKSQTEAALGFVHLRQGRYVEAARELSGPLQPVSKQVERDGYILWKDADLREFGLRPRVLWLAELFEAQGDDKRAATYLLAGVSDDAQGKRDVESRLLALYAKLGRAGEQALADLNQAARRYHALTTPTAVMREMEKRRLLTDRTDTPAPDFKAIGLDKKEIQLADFKDKVAVLVFWATWCGPCVAELPHLQEVADKYAAQPNVIFIAISMDERKLALRPFIKRNGYRLPVAYDVSGAAAFGVSAIPSLIIIDRQGRIAFREPGFGGDGDRYVERLSWRIDELLDPTRSIHE